MIKPFILAVVTSCKIAVLAKITFPRVTVILLLMVKSSIFFTIAFFERTSAFKSFFSRGIPMLSVERTVRAAKRPGRS